MNETGEQNRIVTADEWADARQQLQQREDALLSEQDGLNAARQNLPLTPFDGRHAFQASDGQRSLLDLFDGRRQLIVYHFWFQPGDDETCSGCTMWTNTLGDLTPLAEHDTTLAFVSRAPIAQIEMARIQHRWKIPWYSLVDDEFNQAVGYADIAQLSVFTRRTDDVYLTYKTNTGRDLETITSHWSLLARIPSGS